MPKRPSSPPSTPLGVWLTQWLEDHQSVTHAALAEDIGVSKGVISQWATGQVKAVTPPNLSGLARATGVDLDFLEGLVYGAKAPKRTVDAGRVVLSLEQVQEMINQAAEAGARRVLADLERERRGG